MGIRPCWSATYLLCIKCKQMSEVGIQVAYREPTPTRTNPHCLSIFASIICNIPSVRKTYHLILFVLTVNLYNLKYVTGPTILNDVAKCHYINYNSTKAHVYKQLLKIEYS